MIQAASSAPLRSPRGTALALSPGHLSTLPFHPHGNVQKNEKAFTCGVRPKISARMYRPKIMSACAVPKFESQYPNSASAHIMPRSKEGDASRKRGGRSAQVAAQQKRTLQGAVFPTSDSDRKRFKREEERAESAHIMPRAHRRGRLPRQGRTRVRPGSQPDLRRLLGPLGRILPFFCAEFTCY